MSDAFYDPAEPVAPVATLPTPTPAPVKAPAADEKRSAGRPKSLRDANGEIVRDANGKPVPETRAAEYGLTASAPAAPKAPAKSKPAATKAPAKAAPAAPKAASNGDTPLPLAKQVTGLSQAYGHLFSDHATFKASSVETNRALRAEIAELRAEMKALRREVLG